MVSLFAKAAVIFKGNAHALLDAVIDMNSIPVIKQHVRDLESARDAVNGQLAVATGRVNTLTRNIADIAAEMETAQNNIDLLLGDDDPTNDSSAVTLQVQHDELGGRKKARETDLDAAKQLESGMRDALGKINGRLQTMRSRVQTLEQQDAGAKANEQAASAMEQVASLSDTAAGASIDNAAARVEERAATAAARLNQAFGQVAGPGDDVALAKAKAAIAARKKQLGESKAA